MPYYIIILYYYIMPKNVYTEPDGLDIYYQSLPKSGLIPAFTPYSLPVHLVWRERGILKGARVGFYTRGSRHAAVYAYRHG